MSHEKISRRNQKELVNEEMSFTELDNFMMENGYYTVFDEEQHLILNGVKMLYIQQQIQMKQKYRSSLKSQQITERMKQKKLST